MVPAVALLACFILAGIALQRDTKNTPCCTAALWLPTLWIMRCGSRSIDYWMLRGETGHWDPIFIAILIVLGLLVLSRRPCNWGGILTHNSALFVFYAYLLLSFAWADGLENPAIKLLRPLGDLIMALVVTTEPKPREAIIAIFRRCAILLIPLSIVLIRYYPELGRGVNKHWEMDPWIGVATHKNPLGQLCLVSAIAFLWSLAEAKRWHRSLFRAPLIWFYIAMTAYLFNAGGHSRSSTSLVCLIVVIGLFFLFGHMRDHSQVIIRRLVSFAIALAAVALLLDLFGSSLNSVVAQLQGKEANLTGRTWLWRDVTRIVASESPIVGSGYGAFWVPSIYDKLSPEVDYRPHECHNGYLETFANLGLIGVVLLAWIILQTVRSASDVIQTDFEYGRLRLVLFFAILVMNYTESTFPRGTHLWWFGFLVIAVYAQPWVYWATDPYSTSSLDSEDADCSREPIAT